MKRAARRRFAARSREPTDGRGPFTTRTPTRTLSGRRPPRNVLRSDRPWDGASEERPGEAVPGRPAEREKIVRGRVFLSLHRVTRPSWRGGIRNSHSPRPLRCVAMDYSPKHFSMRCLRCEALEWHDIMPPNRWSDTTGCDVPGTCTRWAGFCPRLRMGARLPCIIAEEATGLAGSAQDTPGILCIIAPDSSSGQGLAGSARDTPGVSCIIAPDSNRLWPCRAALVGRFCSRGTLVIWRPFVLAHASGKPRVAVWPGETRASMVSGRTGMPRTPWPSQGHRGISVFFTGITRLHPSGTASMHPSDLWTRSADLLAKSVACPGMPGQTWPCQGTGVFRSFFWVLLFAIRRGTASMHASIFWPRNATRSPNFVPPCPCHAPCACAKAWQKLLDYPLLKVY